MEKKSEYFDVFIEYNTRFEGWFEAEILKYILDKLSEINIVSTRKKFQNWGQPDIVLKCQNMTWIIELKAGVIGRSRNYFGNGNDTVEFFQENRDSVENIEKMEAELKSKWEQLKIDQGRL